MTHFLNFSFLILTVFQILTIYLYRTSQYGPSMNEYSKRALNAVLQLQMMKIIRHLKLRQTVLPCTMC
jgi:hypothetical protein